MTNLEHYNKLAGQYEETDISAFKMIIVELQANNPNIDFDWCLPRYREVKEWLCSDKYL